MLFRFVVRDNYQPAAKKLYNEAIKILKARGYKQVIVYSASNNLELDVRYEELGMTKGNDYTCFLGQSIKSKP